MLINKQIIGLINRKSLSNIKLNQRPIWGWINATFNRVDPNRIEEVGPDRAAAEWLLRCGASVKWTKSDKYLKDYNALPVGNPREHKIEEIDATDSAIMHIGFSHLKGLTHLRKIIIKNDGYIEDKAIEMLGLSKNTLQHLQIESCIGVTDKGIISLKQLINLKYLKLFDLPLVDNMDKCLNELKNSLINCEIDWKATKPKTFFK